MKTCAICKALSDKPTCSMCGEASWLPGSVSVPKDPIASYVSKKASKKSSKKASKRPVSRVTSEPGSAMVAPFDDEADK